jgi:hypothetical protein
MAHDNSGLRRRRARRPGRSTAALVALPVAPPEGPAVGPTPPPEPVEPSFVCSTCKRDMLASERSRISRAKCRACV